MNLSDKRWIWPEDNSGRIRRLAGETALPPALAGLLLNRGIVSPEQARTFLVPSLENLHSPSLMSGMGDAVNRLVQAIKSKEKITVYGDYDADGITAAVIMVEALRELGGLADLFLPSRFDEGYGLHSEPLGRFKENGTSLVITVDCGINALFEINYARSIGLDLIITDHHQPQIELPEGITALSPLRPGCDYPFKNLSGSGIAFKLASALFEKYGKAWPEFLLDLAALGTAADVVPLLGENRIIVALGLKVLSTMQRPGLTALAKALNLNCLHIDSRALSFMLAPAVNAAGRMGEAYPAAELLLAKDPVAADMLAADLSRLNQLRRSTEQNILAEAVAKAEKQMAAGDSGIIILAEDNWHHGVIGIVASRLADRFNRPVALIALEGIEGKGSIRSVPGFDITAALASSAELLERFGGHEQAAGFTVKRENIARLRESLSQYACTSRAHFSLPDRLIIEAELESHEINLDLCSMLDQLQPFGQDNPVPLLGSRGWELSSWRLVGKEKRHLKLEVRNGQSTLEPIFFNGAHLDPLLEKGGRVDLAFNLKDGNFRDQKTIELIMREIRYADRAQAGFLELIDRRHFPDRMRFLKKLLVDSRPANARVAVFSVTAKQAKTITGRIDQDLVPAVFSGSDLNYNVSPVKDATILVIYDLPVLVDQVRLMLSGIQQPLKVYLLYGSEDLTLNLQMLAVTIPSAEQLKAIWRAFAASGEKKFESGMLNSIVRGEPELFHQPFPRFWEKVSRIYSESGLIKADGCPAAGAVNEATLQEWLECSQTFRQVREIREASLEFQQLMLNSKPEALAVYFNSLTAN